MTEEDDGYGRDERGRFGVGNRGGPGGPRRHQTELCRIAAEAITAERVTAVMRKATVLALQGDTKAMRIVLERACGRPSDLPATAEPLSIELPSLATARGCNDAMQALIDGICKGTVDRDAAKLLIDAIQTRLKAIEVTELEERLAQLEQAADLVQGRRP